MKKTAFDNEKGNSQVDAQSSMQLGATPASSNEELAQLAAKYGVQLRTSTNETIDFSSNSDVYSQIVDKFATACNYWADKVQPRLKALSFAILDGSTDLMIVTEKRGEFLYVHPCVVYLDGAQSNTTYRSTEHQLTQEESKQLFSFASILGESAVAGLNKFDRELVASDWGTAGNFIVMVAKQFNVPATKVRVAGFSEVFNGKGLIDAEVNAQALSRALRVFLANLVGRQGLEEGNTPKFVSAAAYKGVPVLASVSTHVEERAQSNVDMRGVPTFAPIQIVTKARRNAADLSPLATASHEQLSVVGGYMDILQINSQKRDQILRNNGVDVTLPHVQAGVMRYAGIFVNTGAVVGNDGSERLTLPEYVGALFNMALMAINSAYQNAFYPGDMHSGAVDKSYDIGAIGLETPVPIAWENNPSNAFQKINTNPSVYSKDQHRQLLGWSMMDSLTYATDATKSGEWAWLYHLISGQQEKGSEVSLDKVHQMLFQAAVDRTNGHILKYYNPEQHGKIIVGRSMTTPWGIYTDNEGTHDIRRKWNYLSYLNECDGLSQDEMNQRMNQWALLSEMDVLPTEVREKLIVQKMTAMTDNFTQLDRLVRVFWNPVFIQAGFKASQDAGLIVESDISRQQQGATFVRTGFGGAFIGGGSSMMNEQTNLTAGVGPLY